VSRSSLDFGAVQSDDELEQLAPSWEELFAASGSRNPFAHPAWLREWLRMFVPDASRRRILTVRRGGSLVAVAPFYYRRVGGGRTLQLAGAPSREDPLTELSEVLVLPEARRQVLRAVVRELVHEHAARCDWFGITLPQEHGWFDDDWIPSDWRRRGAFSMHKSVRPFSVLPLPESWDELRLKRNLKNAINRSENRHAKLGSEVQLTFVAGDGTREAAAAVQDLHARRARAEQGLVHRDYFQDTQTAAFAVAGTAALAEAGHAYVALCEIGGEPVAGRVVLRAGGATFLSYSGLDARFWQLSTPTLLMTAIVRRAIEQGDRVLNLSLNPDPAKQRWTQQVEIHNEFVVVGPARRSRLLFSLFWQARFGRALRDKRRFGGVAVAGDPADGALA
jgi:CelD/BcsL family acetyltransferase involved in cellulose biosynthesis